MEEEKGVEMEMGMEVMEKGVEIGVEGAVK